MERQPRDRMHQHRLAEGRAETATAAQMNRRLHRHERQRHEFGEAAALFLLPPQMQQMPRPMPGMIDMAEHDRRRGPEADAMRRLDHGQPLRGTHLVRTDDRAYLVVEHFRCRAGQRAETGVFQLGQKFPDRNAERRGALRDLERRERMHMHAGHGVFDRAADREIGRAGIIGMDAALQADLDRAALPGFDRAARDLVEIEIVRPAAQIFAELALGESAELAAEITDIRVVDVARDDIAHAIADRFGAQRIGGIAHSARNPLRARRKAQRYRFHSMHGRAAARSSIGVSDVLPRSAGIAGGVSFAPGIHASARAKFSAIG